MKNEVRLAELLGALSFATDLAAGVPIETSVRTCVLATTLGERMGLAGEALREVYLTALLRHVGCTAYSHEAAALAGGDDHDFLRTFEGVDRRDRVLHGARHLSLTALARVMTRPGTSHALADAQCTQASTLASDLGASAEVQRALLQIYERWDGRGETRGLAGDELAVAARVLHVAEVVEIHTRKQGIDRAVETARMRAGGHLDPEIVRYVDGSLTCDEPFARFLAIEPEPHAVAVDVDAVAATFGRFGDLKAPSRIGHSARVAELVAAAARDWSKEERARVVRAAHLHDLGVVAIPSGVWERPHALSAGAMESVRLHAYHTERILHRTPALADVAAIAGAHHERLDGSGYHRASTSLPRAARLLAVADVYAALRESRPHREAYGADAATRLLRDEARAGRLCGVAVDAVLDGPPGKRAFPANLTAREVEVLGHVARGSTNKEIAAALKISPRTVQHHLEHVYAKIGSTTRAAAALFAARNDLVLETP